MKLKYVYLLLIASFFMALTANAKNRLLATKIIPQYVRQTGANDVYDISGKSPRIVSYDEAQKNNIWNNIKEVPESPIKSIVSEDQNYNPDAQQAYGAWKTRPDLQKEFPDFNSPSTPSKWNMMDWYNKYGKTEYADPSKNFFGLNMKAIDDWKKEIADKKFSYDWGQETGGYYQPDTDEINYNNSLSPEIKRNVIYHEIGHYLTKNAPEAELQNLFQDKGGENAGAKLPLNLLKERVAVAYAGYKLGNIKDKNWIKYFKSLEEKNYKMSK